MGPDEPGGSGLLFSLKVQSCVFGREQQISELDATGSVFIPGISADSTKEAEETVLRDLGVKRDLGKERT